LSNDKEWKKCCLSLQALSFESTTENFPAASPRGTVEDLGSDLRYRVLALGFLRAGGWATLITARYKMGSRTGVSTEIISRLYTKSGNFLGNFPHLLGEWV